MIRPSARPVAQLLLGCGSGCGSAVDAGQWLPRPADWQVTGLRSGYVL